jgi:hypothetical protein
LGLDHAADLLVSNEDMHLLTGPSPSSPVDRIARSSLLLLDRGLTGAKLVMFERQLPRFVRTSIVSEDD